MELDIEKVIEYIYTKLIERGVTVSSDDIDLILELEFEYMKENGFIEFLDE